MTLRLILLISCFFCATMVKAQDRPVETSATNSDVQIHDKKIKGLSGSARKESTGKSLKKDRPDKKRHRKYSESGVFKRHNHFADKSRSARKKGGKKTAKAN